MLLCLFILFLFLHCVSCGNSGCMVDYAQNYDELYDVHIRQSCVFNVTGCTNSNAFNYVNTANVNDVCMYNLSNKVTQTNNVQKKNDLTINKVNFLTS